jgi:hypothetical protein
VDWVAPVSTLIGGLVGIGSTLTVDRLRWQRERRRQLDEVRRQVYVRYLTAVIETEEALHRLASAATGPVEGQAAIETWHEYRLDLCREELRLIAPPAVAEAADRVHDRLVDLRNALTTTKITPGVKGRPSSPEWLAVFDPLHAAQRELRTILRSQVQAV